MGTPWWIELLGWLRATLGDRVVTRFRTRKDGALLAFLAYHGHRSHPRDALVEILWPECDPDAGRHRLRMALSSLRRQLELPGAPPGAVILADRHSVQLNPAAVTTDVARFEGALRAAERAAETEEQLRHLTEAVALYRGALLPSYDEAWVLSERERLAEVHSDALRRLARRYEEAGEVTEALQWARRAVSADPLREEAHRDVIRLLAAAGQTEAALRQYATLERLLAEELSARPATRTRALLREIAAPQGRTEKSRGATVECSHEPVPTAVSAAEFSDPPPASTPAGSLPLQFTRFFGREEEILQLQELLLSGRTRLLTLTGPGGSGKTRLALATAARLRESFQGAAWFVPLVDLADPRSIPARVRDSLRLPRSPDTSPVEQVVVALAHPPSLLLLDNLEHLLPNGVEFLTMLLERAPAVSVLATSRQRLNLPGEREFPVSPLPVPDPPETDLATLLSYPSVQLFRDRAQAARPDFQLIERNAGAIAELCRRLEGLPLAIELAAARAWVLTPAQMLERLSQRFELLARRQNRGDPRHHSLRATLDWSYHLLPVELQRFFARLSVFHGGWTVAAAETICEEPQVLNSLEQLRDASLVTAEERDEEMRFRMLETVREYAREQLSPEEAASLGQRHAQYFLSFAEMTAPRIRRTGGKRWRDRLDSEHDNLRAGLERLAAAGETEAGLRLCIALEGFWLASSHRREGREWLATFLVRERAAEPTVARAGALGAAGRLAETLSDACAFHEESLALGRALDSPQIVSRSLASVGPLRHRLGDHLTGRVLVEEALAIGRRLPDRSSIAGALNSMGQIAYQEIDYEAAHRLFAEGVEIAREAGDRWMESDLLCDLGKVARTVGEYEAARAWVEEALAIRQELGLPGVDNCLGQLATLAECQERYAEAATLYGECLAIGRRLGKHGSTAWTLACLGALQRRQGDFQGSLASHEEGLRLFRALDDGLGMSFQLYYLGELARVQHRYPDAAVRYRESLILAQQSRSKHLMAALLRAIGRLASAQGETMRTARLFAAAETLQADNPRSAEEACEQEIGAARAALGEDAFAAAWAKGEGMSPEEAIADALQYHRDEYEVNEGS